MVIIGVVAIILIIIMYCVFKKLRPNFQSAVNNIIDLKEINSESDVTQSNTILNYEEKIFMLENSNRKLQ